jgi:hypothetical protein
MIRDYKKIQQLVDKSLCFVCGKGIPLAQYKVNNNDIGPKDYWYELELMTNHGAVASSRKKFSNKSILGTGAILRFHQDCFKSIASDDYCFDLEIYK